MYNEMFSNVHFVKGDVVYALAPSPMDLQPGMQKFCMDFIGPLAVSEVLDDMHYKLQLVSNTQDILLGIWHINRLNQGTEITPKGVARSKVMLMQYLTENQSCDGHTTIIPCD